MASDRTVRRLTAAVVLLVAAIAAVVSFVHIEHLATTHGQTMVAACLLPLSIDGTVAAASMVPQPPFRPCTLVGFPGRLAPRPCPGPLPLLSPRTVR